MGAIFAVPLARAGAPDELPGRRVALSVTASETLAEALAGAEEEVTLLIGAEREGLPEDVIEAADHTAHIPIHTESLNAAMAATIALYEITRMAPA